MTEPLQEKICPFLSTAMVLGMAPTSAVDPRPRPVIDLAHVACVKDRCRLWVEGKPEGRCVFEGRPLVGLS